MDSKNSKFPEIKSTGMVIHINTANLSWKNIVQTYKIIFIPVKKVDCNLAIRSDINLMVAGFLGQYSILYLRYGLFILDKEYIFFIIRIFFQIIPF